MHDREPDHEIEGRVIISQQTIREIHEAWDNRVTIQSLAREYDVEETMIRYIISLPRKERPTTTP
jgi:Mor family transcriptional regulator